MKKATTAEAAERLCVAFLLSCSLQTKQHSRRTKTDGERGTTARDEAIQTQHVTL